MRSQEAALISRRSPEDPARRPTYGLRSVTRLLLSIGVAALAGAVLWRKAAGPLSVTTNIVGGTTWYNFNVYVYLYRFYDVALVVPGLAIAVLLVLSRWGPLASDTARGPRVRSRVIPAGEWDIGVEERIGTPERVSWGWLVSAVLRLVPVALAVYVEVAISIHAVSWVVHGIVAALAVAVSTVAAGLLYARFSGASGLRGIAEGVSTANTFATVIPVLLLGEVSSSTFVTIDSQHRVVHYGWCPWWASICLALLLVGLLAWRRLGCSRLAAIRGLERATLLVIAGSVVVFLLAAALPGALGNFIGFDDAQAVVGAKLVFHQGLWPWRNVLLLHGFLPDGVFGQIGLNVFAHTFWGSMAGNSMLIQPMTCVALYLFVVYFSRKSMVTSAVGAVIIVWAPLLTWASSRYILLLVVLVLMDRVLRQGNWRSCTSFIGSLILTAIVVPESTILMLGILGTLLARDVTDWWYYRPQPRAFATTVRCALVGLAFTVVWVVFLLVSGTWSGFVSYYLGTISGHELWGAFAIQPFSMQQLNYFVYAFLPVVLFLATVCRFVWKLRTRRAILSREWVMGATATFVPLFYQVFLDRPDMGHAMEMFSTATPLVLLWGIEALDFLNRVVRGLQAAAFRSPPLNHARRRFSVKEVGSAVALLSLLGWYSSSAAVVKLAASRFQPHVPVPQVAQVPLGYQIPGATNVQQIADLGTVLARYTGTTGPMFDFANEMGVDYYLMNYVPGARYYHVEAAQTLRSQSEEVQDLIKSRPKIIVYFDVYFGIPLYDNIIASVRNYQVSQYLLDHYKPILDLQGQLIMIRNDLAGNVPAPPVVTTPTVTTDLYFQMPHCDWGYTPNFFERPPAAELHGATPAEVVQVNGRRAVVQAPTGSKWSNYEWIEIDGSHGLPPGTMTITDLFAPGSTHDITFKVLPRSGKQIFVRVGSCIQWHGYKSDSLSILTSGTASDLSARLLP